MAKFNFDNAEERKTSNFWNFRENPKVEGILKEIKQDNDGTKTYVLELENKELVTIGSYTTLQERFSTSDINKAVQITFTEEVKSSIKGNKPYMNFKVLIAK